VTPYPFLLFVLNMQSMKVFTQPRPSVVSWDYFWLLWLSKGYSEWSSGHWEVGRVPASRADES